MTTPRPDPSDSPDVSAQAVEARQITANVLLEQVLQEMRQCWGRGQRLRVEDILQDHALLRDDLGCVLRLIQAEIVLRKHEGDLPTAEEYRQRFPQHDALIRFLFVSQGAAGASATSASGDVVHELAPTLTESPVLAGPPTVGESFEAAGYEILDKLGEGGMGVVYKARDRRRGELVALKTLPRLGPASLVRFKQEFRALAGLSHPNLVSLYEMVSDGRVWFFTMELVPGRSFLDWVRSAPLGEEARLRHGLRQLAQAVQALHEAGKLHRDLKPSNVLVTPAGRVVVLDFGLAAELPSSGIYHSSQQLVGTPAYMSPEQAACGAVTPASDWYSVGVMLYQALTVQLPFEGSTVEVLIGKQHRDPRPPTSYGPGVPEDLNALCIDLLRCDPGDRPSGPEVIRRLGSPAPPPAVVGPDRPFVGRERHLGELAGAFAALANGRPVVVFVKGRSGTGKSTLAQRFLDGLAGGDAMVLAGRCYEQERVPFKAVDGLIDALGRYWRRRPRAQAEALLPRDVGALARVFPVLGCVEAVAQAPTRQGETPDPNELRHRAFAALREVLARLGDRCRLILYIDDLQWGDQDSARLLRDVLRPPDAPVLLLLGCYRSEDEQASPFLRSLLQGQAGEGPGVAPRVVEVAPLSLDESRALAQALLGAGGEPAEAIARESGGSPFFVQELAQHAAAGGAAGAGGVPLDEVLGARVERLPADARLLLEVVAVAGRPLAAALACRAAGLAGVPRGAQTALHSAHLITTSGDTDREVWNCYHDRVREAVLARLAGDRRPVCHRQLAEALAGAGPEVQQVFEIAFHFDAAGEAARALPFALAAAEQARAQCSLEEAERQYEIAERAAAAADEATRFRVAEGLGDVLMLRGRYGPAAPRLETARALARTAVDRARVVGKRGDLAFKTGDVKASAVATVEALRLLGRWVPRWRLTFGLGAVWESLVQRLHRLFPGRLGRRPMERGATDLLAVRLYVRLCYAYWFMRGTIPGLWADLRGMNLAERYPPTLELAQIYGVHGMALSLLARYDEAIAFVGRAIGLRRRFNDSWGLGQSFNYYGIILYGAARYPESIEKSREAVRLLEPRGDLWEVNIARYHIATSLYRLGDLRGAIEEAQGTYRAAMRLDDIQMARFTLSVWVRAARGRVPVELLRLHAELPNDDAQATSDFLLAEGVWLLREGRPGEAAERFRRGHAVTEAAGVRNMHTTSALVWLATALREEAERAEPRRAAGLYRQAEKTARTAVRIGRRFPCNLPHALRELGRVLAARGRTGRALRLLEESAAAAAKHGARHEQAQTLLARGRLGLRLSLPGAAEQVTAAQEVLRELETLPGDGERI